MLSRSLFRCVSVAAVLTASAALAYCCGGDYGGLDLPPSVKMPGGIATNVIHDNCLFALTSNGRLIRLHLKTRTVQDYGSFNLKLNTGLLAVGHGKACLVAEKRLHVVDLGTGKVEASYVYVDDSTRKLGLVDGQRVFINDQSGLRVVDVATAAVQWKRDSKEFACVDVAFVPDSCKQLVVIGTAHDPKKPNEWHDARIQFLDAERGTVTENSSLAIAASEGFFQWGAVRIVEDKVYFQCNVGAWAPICEAGYFDLKTRKCHPLNIALERRLREAIQFGPNAIVVPSRSEKSLKQYSTEGKLMGSIPIPENGKRLVSVWNRHALVMNGNDTLEFSAFQQPKAEAK